MENVYRQIVEIAIKNNATKVILFGSRARGDNGPKSDIDLAIYGCKNFSKLVEQMNEELWSLLQLDIINMEGSNVSEELKQEIKRDGVILYDKI
ncbi:MAG: nucleotidyltransferase domain-containing protein [Lachnospiraceae bacterium]|nr:nucleotidyltransferase domain-containing protein [Lachnospiraceae bacterium]